VPIPTLAGFTGAPPSALADEEIDTTRLIKVTLSDGTVRKVARNTPVGVVLRELPASPSQGPVIAARFRNKITSLNRPIDTPGVLAPVHLGSRDGALVYRRTLTFILVRAVTELFTGLQVYINHSLDQGYYCEVYSNALQPNDRVRLAPSDLDRITARMREIIDADEPIVRREYPVEEAIEIFRSAGLHDKVSLLRYSPKGTVSIYRMGSYINHFYGQLAPSTGCVTMFELRATDPGFVIRFPGRSKPDVIPPYRHQEKIFSVLREYERWMRILEWRTVPQLNALIEADRVREYVLIAEALHEKKIAAIADAITNHPRKPRIVLLSGPSSSGKTTTVKRLAIQLRVNGYRPVIIGLDDFFVNREDTPRDEAGEYDFESFHAINVALLQECVRGLLRGEQVQLPKFDFQSGRAKPGHLVRLEPDQILIMEGIHALNDQLLPTIPDGQKFKIYASPLTHLNIDDHNRVPSSDARLLRRIVRDFNYRGYDAVDTLGRWPSVRRGEERNIFPYQENADVVFNSALPYELAALKQFAIPVLQRVKRSEPEFSEAARLLKFLSYFRDIPAEFVPRHSLLREFIGGSCFTY
jgi:uridine kinase